MNGYVSLEMARRLKEAGVKMETNKCWTTYGDKWIIADSDFPFDQIIPAPSLAELWAWLTKNFYLENFYMQWDRTDQTTYVIGPAPDRPIWEVGDNLADALGELAIWMAERKMK